jgi:glycosyltransferase involved in cell wall biosynthesis
MLDRLPFRVVHYGGSDPRTTTGGVETFARNLGLVFDEVAFMTPRTLDPERVRREKSVVICDNQFVLDWPEDIPVIGFQHGVGAVKFRATWSLSHWLLSRKQRQAARRPRTLWVACAQWIAETFEARHGNGASHVVYHPIDVERFDGQLNNDGSRLVLHDARFKHKGRDLIPGLEAAFPAWRFEPLDCQPEEVPDRMREACAFIHLSRYEGNSIVCNEAMAMDLPCFFTRVGLMQDEDRPDDVYVIDPDVAYDDPDRLKAEVGRFLSSLAEHDYHPREWVLNHATQKQSRKRWQAAMSDFKERFDFLA